MRAAVKLFDSCVPNREAENNAKNNYMWPDAVAITKTHKAHILVAVLGDSEDIIEKSKLFVKINTCLCKQKKVLGIYTVGSVFHPTHYEMLANMLKKGFFPIYNLIWFGLYNTEKGICCYTYGMDVFGKYEMEVLYVADAQPQKICDFLSDIAIYVIESDVILKDGETIGFSADDIHTITLSDGVSLPQKTLKISYKNPKFSFVLQEYQIQQQKDFEESLPMTKGMFKKLFDYLAKQSNQGCRHNFEITTQFLVTNKCDVHNVLNWLRENGAGCDCEVIFNIEEMFDMFE